MPEVRLRRRLSPDCRCPTVYHRDDPYFICEPCHLAFDALVAEEEEREREAEREEGDG